MTRALVVLALLLGGQEPDVEALILQLTEGSIEERELAIKALIEAGEKSAPKLRAKMAAAEGEYRVLLSRIVERIAIPRKLRGVLPPISRVNIDAREAGIKTVLEQLQNQTRMPMRLKGLPETPITVRIRDASPLEALNEICRAAKLGKDFPSNEGGRLEFYEPSESKGTLLEGPEIHLLPGRYAEKPRVYVRHYEVEIWEMVLSRTNDFRKGRSRCELTVSMHWPAGLNPHVVHLEVTSVTDDRGNQLLEGPGDPSAAKGWGLALRRHNRGLFRYPDKAVRSLASVRGTARFFYLLESKTVTFENPEKAIGTRKEIEGRSATLADFKTEAGYCTARVRIEGRTALDPPVVRARLESGKYAGPFPPSRIVQPGPDEFEFTLHSFQGKVGALEVVADTVCAEDSFDFEFKDVPLP